jgi:hypothetical protein
MPGCTLSPFFHYGCSNLSTFYGNLGSPIFSQRSILCPVLSTLAWVGCGGDEGLEEIRHRPLNSMVKAQHRQIHSRAQAQCYLKCTRKRSQSMWLPLCVMPMKNAGQVSRTGILLMKVVERYGVIGEPNQFHQVFCLVIRPIYSKVCSSSPPASYLCVSMRAVCTIGSEVKRQ